MNTIQLECFLATARHLNFSKVAEELKITQPAVSHQIRTLEDELGVKLFLRTSRNVSITEEGRSFMPDADKMLKIAASAHERLSSKDRSVLFEIGCQNRIELELLPPVLKRLYKELPNLRPEPHIAHFEILSELLESGQLQICFGWNHLPSKTALKYRALKECTFSCICSPDHPLAAYHEITQDMLTGNIILCDPHRIDRRIFQMQSNAASSHPVSTRYFSDNIESAIALVKSGIGYTIFPDLGISSDPDLLYIPFSDIPPISFGMYCRESNETDAIRRFWKTAKEIWGDTE